MKKVHELLPIDQATRSYRLIKPDLNNYSFLLVIAQKACEAWEQKRFEDFDALVGENACQIRAIRIALLSRKEVDIVRLKRRIMEVKESLDRWIHSLESTRLLEAVIKSKKSLQNILNERGLDIEITKNQKFVLQSFLLSVAKTLIPSLSETPLLRNDIAAPDELMRFGDCTRGFLKNLVAETRKQLSQDSVQFIYEMAIQIGDQESQKMSSGEFVIVTERNTRCCIPCFYSFKVFASLISVYRVPFILRCWLRALDQGYKNTGEILLFFKPDSEGFHNSVIPSPDEAKEPAIILEGCMARENSELINEGERSQDLLKHKPLDLVLAYAAHHRQYPIESKDVLVESLRYPSYENYKQFAKDWGCSLDNPRLFFINHVYCSSWASIEAKKSNV